MGISSGGGGSGTPTTAGLRWSCAGFYARSHQQSDGSGGCGRAAQQMQGCSQRVCIFLHYSSGYGLLPLWRAREALRSSRASGLTTTFGPPDVSFQEEDEDHLVCIRWRVGRYMDWPWTTGQRVEILPGALQHPKLVCKAVYSEVLQPVLGFCALLFRSSTRGRLTAIFGTDSHPWRLHEGRTFTGHCVWLQAGEPHRPAYAAGLAGLHQAGLHLRNLCRPPANLGVGQESREATPVWVPEMVDLAFFALVKSLMDFHRSGYEKYCRRRQLTPCFYTRWRCFSGWQFYIASWSSSIRMSRIPTLRNGWPRYGGWRRCWYWPSIPPSNNFGCCKGGSVGKVRSQRNFWWWREVYRLQTSFIGLRSRNFLLLFKWVQADVSSLRPRLRSTHLFCVRVLLNWRLSGVGSTSTSLRLVMPTRWMIFFFIRPAWGSR